MNAIEVSKLTKHYPNFALEKADIVVPNGYVCGFVGPNGAGKTTALKCMLGMVRPDGGEVKLLGRDVSDASVKEDVGVLFDQPYFQEDWKVKDIENALSPFYRRWSHDDYVKYLKLFELDAAQKFKNFSRGQKMKLGMATILSRGAKLLLLDEPTGGLDPVARDEMLDLMREYMEDEQRTILFSTHITSDLEKIADTIIYISHGRIAFSGEKDELTERYCVVRGGVGELPRDKRAKAHGYREHSSGYECLMDVADIGGLPPGAVTDKAAIDDIVVFMERGALI
ncbi:ABC transporter ATP-binding protein [Clostridia bacterium]|nr:ABC transporter ATP-binding protein [Clostridia bacterium]